MTRRPVHPGEILADELEALGPFLRRARAVLIESESGGIPKACGC